MSAQPKMVMSVQIHQHGKVPLLTSKGRGCLMALIAGLIATNINTLHIHSSAAIAVDLTHPPWSWDPPAGLAVGRPYPSAAGPRVVDRDVPLLEGPLDYGDAFSAAWWQPTDKFLAMDLFEELTPSPEGASFAVFTNASDDVKMTKDWLDLGVEHMSKWWKMMLWGKGRKALRKSLEERVVQILKRYARSRDRRDFLMSLPSHEHEGSSRLATESTLVVIAYMENTSDKDVWSLAATIMSLLQVGMGRIVVASDRPTDADIVQRSFSIVEEITSRWGTNVEGASTARGAENKMNVPVRTELQHCLLRNATSVDPHGKIWVNVPQASLRQLRHIFEGKESDEDVRCWLGASLEEGRARWTYTFLHEPDLLLVTKPDALPGLGRMLREGRILAPHRLQPLPHGFNFAAVEGTKDGTRVIPHAPPFDEVVEIDTFALRGDGAPPLPYGAFDSCCDRGGYRPHLAHEPCRNNAWGHATLWMCGFGELRKKASIEAKLGVPPGMIAHRRLLGYQLMILSRGTGVVFAGSNTGKTCRPRRGGCEPESDVLASPDVGNGASGLDLTDFDNGVGDMRELLAA